MPPLETGDIYSEIPGPPFGRNDREQRTFRYHIQRRSNRNEVDHRSNRNSLPRP